MKLASIRSCAAFPTLILPALIALQGCDLTSGDVPLGNTGDSGPSGSSGSEAGGASGLATSGAGGVGEAAGTGNLAGTSNCPVYSAPLCAEDETLGSGADANGCPMSVCVPCPEYSAPLCGNAETLGSGTDANGCPMPVCVPCPEYAVPNCSDGQTLVSDTDAEGCRVPSCVACPDYARVACSDNETLVQGVDAEGCAMPKCIVCPEYADPSCDGGAQLTTTTDAEGCPMPVCTACPIYGAPACAENELLVWLTDAQGCEAPTCECPVYDTPNCVGDLELVWRTDDAGCSAPECIVCPEYSSPRCLEGQGLVYTNDAQGCPMPICDPLTPGCFSPIQNLDIAFAGGVGCACSEDAHDRCVSGTALMCQDDYWTAVEDGPCMPSICNEPLDIDNTCERAEWVGYWHNAATGQCEPFTGGCPRGNNAFATFEECASACQDKLTTAAVVPWDSCFGLGEQISVAGDETTFLRTWDVITKELSWGCGCPERPEFVIAYELASPLRLRLCHDEMADSCEAGCAMPVSFDLGQALQEAGTTRFEFVD